MAATDTTTTARAGRLTFARHLQIGDTIVSGLGEYDDGSLVIDVTPVGNHIVRVVTESPEWGAIVRRFRTNHILMVA